ncbi:MAG: EAL domain-containing protein [Gammaproteobacteria bacterium]|nr:EAL domain-containing protein [Gammaproteobacteria bacterium]
MTRADALFRTSELKALTDHVEDYVQIFDLELRSIFVNRALCRALGRAPRELRGRRLAELGAPPELCAQWEAALHAVAASGEAQRVELQAQLARGRRLLQILIAPIKDAAGRVQALFAITRDVTEGRQAEALRSAQHEVMREIAGGAELPGLMQTVVRLTEQNAPGRLCSLLLADADGRHLRPGHAPQLPAELIEAICRQPIGPGNACCGAAAFHRHPVIAPDIASDAAWAAHRELALKHGLRACWSQPILSADGALLGTVAMYHRKPRAPYELELRVLNEAALVAAVAIQHRRTLDSLLDVRERYRALTEHAANIVSVTDMKGVMLEVSPAIKTILGYEPGEIVGRNSYELVHPDDLPKVRETLRRLREQVGTEAAATYRYRHRNGGWRMLETIAKSRLNHRGEYIAVVNSRDVTQHEDMTAALRVSEERLERALAASALGLWDWDVATGRIYMDERCHRNMGYEPGDLRDRIDSLIAIIHPDDAVRVGRIIEAHLRGETPHYEYEARLLTRDRRWVWVQSSGQVTIRNEPGEPVRVTGTIRNIDAHKRVQENLDRATKRIQMLLGATDEGIIGLEPDGKVSFVNPAATRLLGCAAEDVLGRDFNGVIRHTRDSGEEVLGHDSPIHRCLTEGRRYRSGNDDVFTCGGRSFPVDYSVSPIVTDESGEGAVLVFHDVSEKRSLAHQLQFQALHDPLTGLVNRRGFEARLSELLGNAKRENREHALLYLDLDHFKLVNDTCGHAAGDELLRQLPKVLQPLVRKHDAIARLGGDEFGILLQDCPLNDAARIAEAVRDAVKGFRFIWQYRTFTIGVSVGVVGVTAESQGLISVLGAADTACYVAKDQGPNNVHVSYPHDLAIIRRRGEMRWVARLKSALEEDRFTLYFQSIAAFDRPEERPAHHELLIRLLDNKGDVILPGAFIAAAERYQLMPSIDNWVLEHALRYVGEVVARSPHFQHHRFGINLSGESLRDARLLDTIRNLLKRHTVPPTMLYFEITETAAISNLGAAVEFMRGLKQLGCQLALDDFGSGMSSFSYLKHLPVDYLKIDGGFVKDILNSPVDQAIVRAINSVGQQMGIRTVAEFVENAAISNILREIGVNYGQGFGIARPQPLENFPMLFGQKVAVG